MNRRSRTTRSYRTEHPSVFAVLKSHLEEARDDAAWYAQRMEALGRVLFGDLWEEEKLEARNQSMNSHEPRPQSSGSTETETATARRF